MPVGSLPPATGKTMRFTGTTILKVENGLITEEIGLDDGVTVATATRPDHGGLTRPQTCTRRELIVTSISRKPAAGRLQDVTGKQPFETVVTRHGATVLRVCRAVLGPADADDAWSETFLSAMKAYPDLPADANVEAWLVTIAHRKAIDVTRAAPGGPYPSPRFPTPWPRTPQTVPTPA